MPPGTTENETVCPMVTVWLNGCVVMLAGTFTVNVAPKLVTEPATLVTTTE